MLGPDVFVAVLVLAVTLGLPLWAIVDVLGRPAVALYAAGSNKTAWVLVLVVSLVFGIGFLFGGYYLLAVRRKVEQQTRLL